MKKKKIVFFTGAGISVESGVPAFRTEDGTWEEHDVMEVATMQGWKANREKVLNFYNDRFNKMNEVFPNLAHNSIASLESEYDVTVLTQNVDNLHERSGSTNVIHLHGELTKMCSSMNKETHITDIPEGGIVLGEKAPDGSQWRPYIVWFGEMVPNYEQAIGIIKEADIVVVIGTSLQVQPVSMLPRFVKSTSKLIIINPDGDGEDLDNATMIKKVATEGMAELIHLL